MCCLPTRLTHLQPETHCPQVLPRAMVEQLAADMDHFVLFGDLLKRMAQVRAEWDTFRLDHPENPTVRALAAAGVDYDRTGFFILSLCLPAGCCYRHAGAVNNRLARLWHRRRAIPANTGEVIVEHGIFVQGWLTSAILTGRGGLLHLGGMGNQ